MSEPMSALEVTDELIARQLELEAAMTSRGADRYVHGVSKAIEKGMEDATDYGKIIIAGRVQKLTEAITTWKAEASSGKPGRKVAAFRLVEGCDDGVLAYLALRHVMARVSSTPTVQEVAVGIGGAVEDEMRLAKVRCEERKTFDRLLIGAKKRSSQHHKHIYAARAAEDVVSWDRWTRTDRLHVGVSLLNILQDSIGLIEIVSNSTHSEQAAKHVKALPETLEWIESRQEHTQLLRPIYDPMVVPPRDWTTPYDGGYLSSGVAPITFIKTRNRAYLEELENTDMPIVYSAVNAIQRTPWQINTEVLTVMRTLWDSGSSVAELPPKDGLALPVKPHDIDTNETSQKAYRTEAARVYQRNTRLLGRRIGFNMILSTAERYSEYPAIYFPYQLDFRGRIYAVPSINPQGTDYTKALLRFADGKPLGAEGWKWLAVHGSNLAGYDKASLEDRVQWVLDNEEEILAVADDPYGCRGWCTEIAGIKIDKPWQFLSFCFEWRDYLEQGDKFISKIPIAMDGSCSGIQHFSAMLRDEIGGSAVNLIPQDLPADVYRMVAEKVLEQIELDKKHGTADTLKHNDEGQAYVMPGTKAIALQWEAFGVNRKVTKRSVMTLAYGSKQFGFKEQLMEDIILPAKSAATAPDGTIDTKRFPFDGDGFRAANYMASAIWDAVNKVLVKAGEAMRWLQDAAALAAKEDLPVRWTTAVGFPVMQAYPALEARRIKTAINGSIIRLLMYQEKEGLDRRKQGQGISPNFIHSCDAAHLMLTVVRATQEGLTNFSMIHDSFGTTAGDAEKMYRTVRESFVEMYEDVAVLENFKEELEIQLSPKQRSKLKPLPLRGALDLGQVVESRFCFA